MTIIYSKTKRSKPKNTAEARRLAAEWEALKAKHAAPLVKGAKANGIKVEKPRKSKQVPVLLSKVAIPVPKPKDLPIPLTTHTPGTKPAVDVLAEAKAGLRNRVGQVFNKGGIQYMTDSDLNDAKSGLLRRRS